MHIQLLSLSRVMVSWNANVVGFGMHAELRALLDLPRPTASCLLAQSILRLTFSLTTYRKSGFVVRIHAYYSGFVVKIHAYTTRLITHRPLSSFFFLVYM